MFTVTIVICFAMLGCFRAGDQPLKHYQTKAECIKRGEDIVGRIKAMPMTAGQEVSSLEITCTPDGGKSPV